MSLVFDKRGDKEVKIILLRFICFELVSLYLYWREWEIIEEF